METRGAWTFSPAAEDQPKPGVPRVGLGVALQLGPLKFCEIRANQKGIPIRKNQRNEEDDGLFKGVTEGWDKKTCRGSSNRWFVPWLGRVLFAILQLHEWKLPVPRKPKVSSWKSGRVGFRSGQVRYGSEQIEVEDEVDVESRSGRVESGTSNGE